MIKGHRHWLLSGGIGSGKSLAGRLLGDAGWQVVDSDSVGHGVLKREGPAFRDVATRWPEVIVDGDVDRAALGQIVFADADELDRLERITHPHIFGRILDDIQGIDGFVAVEIPLLKNPFGPEWRRMVVDSGDEDRLTRLRMRGMTEGEVKARMTSQPSRREWLAAADVVVPNHRDEKQLSVTVRRLTSAMMD